MPDAKPYTSRAEMVSEQDWITFVPARSIAFPKACHHINRLEATIRMLVDDLDSALAFHPNADASTLERARRHLEAFRND